MATKTKKDTLYRMAKVIDGWTVYKMDEDYDVLQTYNISEIPSRSPERSFLCSCPARVYPCRHVKILQKILQGQLPLYYTYSFNKGIFFTPP